MYVLKMSGGGRIVIPASVRKALGIKEGDTLMLDLVENEAHLYSRREQLRRAQALVRQYVPANVSLVDELIIERRSESEPESTL